MSLFSGNSRLETSSASAFELSASTAMVMKLTTMLLLMMTGEEGTGYGCSREMEVERGVGAEGTQMVTMMTMSNDDQIQKTRFNTWTLTSCLSPRVVSGRIKRTLMIMKITIMIMKVMVSSRSAHTILAHSIFYAQCVFCCCLFLFLFCFV